MYGKVKIFATLTVVVAVSILFANISQGQEITPATKEGGGMGYSMLGRSTIDIKDLNTKLESKGYSKISDNFFSVGGGGHGIINNRLIIGGEGHGLLGEEVTSGNYKNSLNIGYGFFDLGYIVYSIKDLRVYPLLGLGGGGMNLKIAEKLTSLSFDNVLDNPKRNVELSTSGFLLNLALGIDYLLKFGEDEKGRAGMILGLRAGYTLSPFKGGWEMDEIEISGAPEIGITGPYIRLMIGGGEIGKKE
jgi:hypothetical protein